MSLKSSGTALSNVIWIVAVLSMVSLCCEGRPRTRYIRIYLKLPFFPQRNPPQKPLFKDPWEINRDVCPPSLCTWHEESKAHRPNVKGSLFYNGDIVLDNDMRTRLFKISKWTSQKHRTKRATVRRKSRLWTKGKIPYILSKDLGKKYKKAIKKAMKHIEEFTCIRFTKRKPKDVDYLYFINEPGCWSSIGRVSGQQKMSFGEGCGFFGTVLHEMTHALGFWHEQSRPDRDDYVRIMKENIPEKYQKDFNKIKSSVTLSRGYPYDYRSVTHYSETAYTLNGKSTIEVIGAGKDLKLRIGQRKGLSNLDIAQLNDMYKCNQKQDSMETVCQDGWQKFGRSCYKFVTQPKSQFAAATKHCQKFGAKLVSIESSKEDSFLKKHLSSHHANIDIWRTGGRKVKDKFVWHNVILDKDKAMKFTKWAKGHPGTFSSMALVRDIPKKWFSWHGVWAGSQSQLPANAHPFICEKASKRECFHSKHLDGRDYRGRRSHTESGITCQKWSSQWPHRHKARVTTKSREEDGLGDHNLCRNPTAMRRSRPWCFSTKERTKWQYCDVTICKQKLEQEQSKSYEYVSSRRLIDV